MGQISENYNAKFLIPDQNLHFILHNMDIKGRIKSLSGHKI
jgi:hypothetical protein